MFTLALSSLLLALVASPVMAQDDSTDGINISSNSSGTFVSSDYFPVQCLVGCILPSALIDYCLEGGGITNDTATCGASSFCSGGPTGNYTNIIACFECLGDNGAQAPLDAAAVSSQLSSVNSACSSLSQGFTAASYAVSATTTGPFSASTTGNTLTLPTWTGLTAFVTDSSSGGVLPSSGVAGSGSASGASGTTPTSRASATSTTARSSGASGSTAAAGSSTSSHSAAALPTAAAQAGLILAAAGMAMGVMA